MTNEELRLEALRLASAQQHMERPNEVVLRALAYYAFLADKRPEPLKRVA